MITQVRQESNKGLGLLRENDIINVIAMSDLHPGVNDEGLVVLSASNRDQEDVDVTGALTITFSRAVTLVDEADCSVGLSLLGGGVPTAALDFTDPPGSTMAITGDGTTTLVLTPQLAIAVGEDDDGLIATYAACYITVDDDLFEPINIFSVPYVDSTPAVPTTVDTTVPMTDWN